MNIIPVILSQPENQGTRETDRKGNKGDDK